MTGHFFTILRGLLPTDRRMVDRLGPLPTFDMIRHIIALTRHVIALADARPSAFRYSHAWRASPE